MQNPIDGPRLAASIGAIWHNTESRTVKPLFGKARAEYAHLMSHPTPRVAIATLHANLVHSGAKVGMTNESRVQHADGFMANCYSFHFMDEHGAKHFVHMMRPVGRLQQGG